MMRAGGSREGLAAHRRSTPVAAMQPDKGGAPRVTTCAARRGRAAIVQACAIPIRPSPGSFTAGRRRSIPATPPRILTSIRSTQPRVTPA